MSIRSAASCGQPRQLSVGAARRADRAGAPLASLQRSRSTSTRRPTRSTPGRRRARSAAAELGREPAVGAGPGHDACAARRAPRRCPRRAAAARAARVPARAHDELDGEDPARGWRRRPAACAPRPSPSRRGPPASRWSGSESTLAGAARRRFSATIAACVYWAIISPELTPGVGGEERRQAVRARRGRAAGRCAARRSRRRRRRAIARKSQA